jgi:hypothetical protein
MLLWWVGTEERGDAGERSGCELTVIKINSNKEMQDGDSNPGPQSSTDLWNLAFVMLVVGRGGQRVHQEEQV